jgi:hypothetical protein
VLFPTTPAAGSTNACPTPFDNEDDVDDAGTLGAVDPPCDAADPSCDAADPPRDPAFLARGLGLLASVACLVLAPTPPLPDLADDAALTGLVCHAGVSYRRHMALPMAVDADDDLIVLLSSFVVAEKQNEENVQLANTWSERAVGAARYVIWWRYNPVGRVCGANGRGGLVVGPRLNSVEVSSNRGLDHQSLVAVGALSPRRFR